MIAFVNATSSTFCIWAGLQQRPTFHELPTPFGKIVMKPLLSPSVAHPDRPFCPEPEPPSGWKSMTTGTGSCPYSRSECGG